MKSAPHVSLIAASRRVALLAVGALLFAACASTPKPMPVGDTIAARADLSELSKLMDAAGLRATLNQGGPYTVFAPTNEAVNRLSESQRADLAKDPARLRAVLSFHVLPQELKAADVKNSALKTLEGQNLPLARAGNFVIVDEATVQAADLPATNGIVHTIDRVVIPPAPRR